MKLHNKELICTHPKYHYVVYIKENEVGGTCGMHGRGEKLYKVLVGKPEGKRPVGRPTRRWEDGIRIDLKGFGWWVVEWIYLAQNRDRWRVLVNTVINLRVLAPRN
jgi:hypothetical protein